MEPQLHKPRAKPAISALLNLTSSSTAKRMYAESSSSKEAADADRRKRGRVSHAHVGEQHIPQPPLPQQQQQQQLWLWEEQQRQRQQQQQQQQQWFWEEQQRQRQQQQQQQHQQQQQQQWFWKEQQWQRQQQQQQQQQWAQEWQLQQPQQHQQQWAHQQKEGEAIGPYGGTAAHSTQATPTKIPAQAAIAHCGTKNTGSVSSGVGARGQAGAEGRAHGRLNSGEKDGNEGLMRTPQPPTPQQQQQQQQQHQGGILISTPAELRTLAASIRQAGSFAFVLLFKSAGRRSSAAITTISDRFLGCSTGSHGASEVQGMGISVGGGNCYYVQLSARKGGRQEQAAEAAAAAATKPAPAAAGGSNAGSQADADGERKEMYMLLRELLKGPKLCKVTYRLKEQLTALSSSQPSSNPAAAAPPHHANAAMGQVQLSSSSSSNSGSDSLHATIAPFDVAAPVLDMLIGAWILNPSANKETNLMGASGKQPSSGQLLELVKRHLGNEAATQTKALLDCPRSSRRSAELFCWRGKSQAEVMLQAALAHRLYFGIAQDLQKARLCELLMNIEMRLVPLLAQMESNGIGVDLRIILDQRPPLQLRREQLKQHVNKLAGRRVDLSTPQDVSCLLYKNLRIPVPANAEHKETGHITAKSTDLLDMRFEHDVVPIILEHRHLSKQLELLQSVISQLCQESAQAHQYYVSFCGRKQISLPQSCLVRMHGTFLQAGTDTGRLAMTEPSLHVVPCPIEYKLEVNPGAAGESSKSSTLQKQPPCTVRTVSLNIRAAFVAPPGHVFLSVDYKQLELRMLAHLSGNADLCATFSQSDVDPFQRMVCFWLKCDVSQVTKAQRESVKRLTYGLIYGMGLQRLANELNMAKDVEKVSRWKDSFLNAVPGLLGAIEWTKTTLQAQVRLSGMVSTLAGRRRLFGELKQGYHREGSGADLIKSAMVKLHSVLDSSPEWAGAAKLVLMFHDELLYEVPEGCVSKVAPLLKDVLTNAWRLRVPTPVDIKCGPDWGHLRKWNG